eukprot:CAMPEP_0180247022 /NCGR_PEP_ID=MMETSP0987-20121128/35903_1 /TAXON_ID=697907 /ORGANISM="non described non described, Strain CCMP2293" /LENGTH=261 /DNA_ID=CAMNT_0022214911 /DNA_START=221 /DNA_END=1002 /DNA_ORIENTATION=+
MTSLPTRLGGRLLLSDFTDEVKHELDVDPKSCALIAAAKKGNMQLGALATDAGDDVDAVNGDGECALHLALNEGHTDFALWLLSHGANPAMRDRHGQDCAHWAYDDMWVKAALDRHRSRTSSSSPTSRQFKFPPEVMALAEHLGVAGKGDSLYTWIAEAAHHAPLPPNWAEHVDEDGAVFFHCKDNGQSSWDHPMDKFYRKFIDRARKHAGNFDFVLNARARKAHQPTPKAKQQPQHTQRPPPESLDSSASPASTDLSKGT